MVQTEERAGLGIAPLTPTIGAEILGVDLTKPLSAAEVSAIRQALLDWKVVFFRDQDITTEQHLAFGRHFGALEVHPFAASKPGFPEVLVLSHGPDSRGNENIWHSDVTWRLEPSLGSILRAVETPPFGGDTLFADMYAAYESLSEDVKAQIDGAFAMHDYLHYRQEIRGGRVSEEEARSIGQSYPPPTHPVVRTHPETGRKALYVNRAFTVRIEGLDKARSDELLRHLYAQAAIPEHQCRFRWSPNAIAFWDNRATQHYAVSDYWPAVRRMERVTVIGDRPR
jgi:taurine dioxygenase